MRFVKTAESIFDIPSGFTRVEYLESTGTQYIDTGYIPKPTSSYKCGFELTNITTTSGAWFCVFGSVENDNSTFTELFLPRASGGGNVNQVLAGNHNTSYLRKDYTWAVNTIYNFEMSPTNVLINGVSQGSISVDSSITCNHSIYLFARHEYNDAVRYIVSAKIHSFKVYEGNTLVHDFIPCIDPLGVPCMYDLVGKKAYYNQGTGEFTVGRQIIPVEYLESTGTQYIDTGVLLTDNSRIEITSQSTDASQSNNTLIGCGTGGSSSDRVQVHFGSAAGILSERLDGFLSENQAVGTTKFNAVLDIKNKKAYFNDVEIISTFSGSICKTVRVAIFNRMVIGNVVESNFYAKAKVYSCHFYDDGVLIRDLIPCKDENDVGFMFDTLSGTVYENAGTGAFVVGQNKYKAKLRLIRDNILPTGYTQIEYIEATNSGNDIQYAVGNYRLTNTTDWEITFSAKNSGNNWVMGQPTWIGVHYRKDTSTSNLPRVGITNSSSSANQCYVDYTDNEKITLALKGTDVYANGVKVGSITRISAPDAQTKYGIFAYKTINQELPNLRIQSARIYRLKIWDNDVMVQDLIPAINSDGVAGFYERVNKTFIEKESNSTSDFTTGKPILPIVRFPVDPVPVGYKTVNYLESTGTQYIDTGITGTNENMGIDVTWAFSNTDANMCIFSSRSAQTSNSFTLFWLKTAANRIRFDTTGQPYFSSGVNTSASDDIFNFNYKSAEGAVATLTNKTTEQIQTLNIGKLTTFSTNPLYLFGSRDAGAVGSSIKMYNCQIYDSNTIIRNFIPVIRLLDNKAGMWDTVTKQFYTTPVGDFITG